MDNQAQQKAHAFERAVADVVLWHIERVPNKNDIDRRIILIQGPMLPKLRGRLQYRMPSKETIICSLTYQREWLRRLEMASADASRLLASVPDRARTILGEIFPPKGLDAGSRTWLAMKNGTPYHFEVITSTQSGPQSVWVKPIQDTLFDIVDGASADNLLNGKVYSDDIAELPVALAEASRRCKAVIQIENWWLSIHAELSWLKCYEGDQRGVPHWFPSYENRPDLWCLSEIDGSVKVIVNKGQRKCRNPFGSRGVKVEFPLEDGLGGSGIPNLGLAAAKLKLRTVEQVRTALISRPGDLEALSNRIRKKTGTSKG